MGFDTSPSQCKTLTHFSPLQLDGLQFGQFTKGGKPSALTGYFFGH